MFTTQRSSYFSPPANEIAAIGLDAVAAIAFMMSQTDGRTANAEKLASDAITAFQGNTSTSNMADWSSQRLEEEV